MYPSLPEDPRGMYLLLKAIKKHDIRKIYILVTSATCSSAEIFVDRMSRIKGFEIFFGLGYLDNNQKSVEIEFDSYYLAEWELYLKKYLYSITSSNNNSADSIVLSIIHMMNVRLFGAQSNDEKKTNELFK